MVSTVQENPVRDGKAEPAPNVLLLPSHFFFVRRLALPAGISPEELPSFVELSLEQMSPFALNQLYYGYYQPAEGSDLLVFAAYRKQLSVYEDEAWTAAELVLPDFAALLGLSREGPLLAFLQDEFELTAVYWSGAEGVPDRVLSRRIQPGENGLDLDQAREELRRKIGPLAKDVTVRYLDGAKGAIRDRDLHFELRQEGEAKEVSAEIPRPVFWTMDVRDKLFLQASRQMQRRNRWIWNGVLVILAAFLALGVFEAALFAGEKILSSRENRLVELEPEVARIMQEEELALRLEELQGERLLPFEMLAALNEFRPPSVYYTRVITDGLRSFEIEALTPKSQDVDRFQRRLESADALESVEIRGLRLRAQDGRSSFVLAGTFREGSLSSAPETKSGGGNNPAPDSPGLEIPEGASPPAEEAAAAAPPRRERRRSATAADMPEIPVPAQALSEEESAASLPELPAAAAGEEAQL